MLSQVNENIASIPLVKIFILVIIWSLTIGFKQIITDKIIIRIEGITAQTNSKLDDQLVQVIKPPLAWLIFLAGLGLSKVIIGDYLGTELNQILGKLINFFGISIGAYIIYRLAPILGEILKNLTLRTNTDLDDLFVPYLPKIFQIGAILLILLKGSEVFLGTSATAILGLLGGAGLAFGLLLKDVIYDTCCTIIIYLDKIYRVGDIVVISDISGFTKVLDIGLRSTTLCVNKNNSMKKIPNSKMINGIVENWSQNPDANPAYGINLTLKIDNISAKKAAIIYEGLGEIPKSINLLYERTLVRIEGIEQNAIIFSIRVLCKDLDDYSLAQAALTLAVLEFLEKEQINYLNVS